MSGNSLRQRMMARLHGPVYAARVRELVRRIGPWLEEGDRVLDVGCGGGALGRALMDAASPGGVRVEGLERRARGNEAIPVTGYDGGRFPFDDAAFDVVILADVLHHEADPDGLLAECRRVARRLVIVKDHKVDGPFAHARICLLDWAANDPYGVPCLYRYPRLGEWRELFARHTLPVAAEHTRLRLYPFPYWLFFTDRLQYLAALEVGPSAPAQQAASSTAAFATSPPRG